jgi:hypothetical protein
MVRRKALLIGINYAGTGSALAGCIHDATNVHNLLRRLYGNAVEVHFLKETDKNRANHPTKANIMREFNWLTSGNQPGDKLFVHYSGHGGSIRDDDRGEEKDNLDETLVPLDVHRVGHVRDDDLRVALIDKVGKGVKLLCLFDCCHSGTILDLKYGYVQPQTGKVKSFTNNTPETAEDIVLFSGCKDHQYSWEVYDERKIQGAMTNAFVKSMIYLHNQPKSNPGIQAKIRAQVARRKKYEAALRRNRRNKKLVRINRKNIAACNKKIAALQARAKAAPAKPVKVTYANLMAHLLKHLKKGGNKQDPQISSGRALTLQEEVVLV